jgi:hypothetical protein
VDQSTLKDELKVMHLISAGTDVVHMLMDQFTHRSLFDLSAIAENLIKDAEMYNLANNTRRSAASLPILPRVEPSNDGSK